MKNRMRYILMTGICCMVLGTSLPVSAEASEAQSGVSASDVMKDVLTQSQSPSESASTQKQDAGSADTKEEVTSVEDAKNGVLQINSVYVDEAKTDHIVAGGAGFLIGSSDGDDNSEYIITSEHVINPDTKTRDAAFKYYKVNNDNDKWDQIDLQIRAVVENDIVVNASVVSSSKELDMAVLKLEQPIYNRKYLTLLTDDADTAAKACKVTDPVFSLGFPTAISFDKNAVYYSGSNVSMSSGFITNLTTTDNISMIQHDATIAANNCGGPLVNADGEVIGMNLLKKDGNYYDSLSSTDIARILDALGIKYNKCTVTQKQADTRAAEQAKEASEEASSAAAAAMISMPAQQEEKSGIPLPFLILLCVLIVAVIATGAVLAVVLTGRKTEGGDQATDAGSKKKKKNKKKEDAEAGTDRFANPVSQYGNVATAKAQYPEAAGIVNSGSSMETSVLGGNTAAGSETTILGSGVQMQAGFAAGTLIRRKTGENIIVNKPLFRIGKDSLHTDYCIKDNSAISRIHAQIHATGGEVSVEDCRSTNGTFVNSEKLIPEQPVTLHSGDVIKLGNEEFEYRN